MNRPVNFSIGGEVRKAAYSVQNLIDGVETYIEDDAYKAKVVFSWWVRGWVVKVVSSKLWWWLWRRRCLVPNIY